MAMAIDVQLKRDSRGKALKDFPSYPLLQALWDDGKTYTVTVEAGESLPPLAHSKACDWCRCDALQRSL